MLIIFSSNNQKQTPEQNNDKQGKATMAVYEKIKTTAFYEYHEEKEHVNFWNNLENNRLLETTWSK